MEFKTPPIPRRAKNLEQATETGRIPYIHPLASPGYEVRFCEGSLKLDDNSMLPVFISVTGKDGDGDKDAAIVETCWENPAYPRSIPDCEGEKAPGR